jgi:putative ABC transport system substrate-binding protein
VTDKGTRRDIVLATAHAAICLALPARASTELRRVGLFSIGSPAVGNASDRMFDPFRAAMRAAGWAEGRNVSYVERHAGGDVSRLDMLAAELVAARPEAIVVGNPPLTRAVQKATRTIPIVMANVSDAVENKFVQSLARPGGNITGTTSRLADVVPKVVELLHELAPQVRRIAVLLNETNQSHAALWTRAQEAARALGLQGVRIAANSADAFPAAMGRVRDSGAQGIVVVADQMFGYELARLAPALRSTGLPVACASRALLPAGIVSYAADWQENYRRAAVYVDRILKGARPADLPVEQPVKFDLAVNMKAAQALGLRVPQSLLLRADEVI